MGCGTWGGNIVSENICLKHYMNTTWVARPLPEDMPSNEELFGEFNKPVQSFSTVEGTGSSYVRQAATSSIAPKASQSGLSV